MNAMNHELPDMIGVDQRKVEEKIRAILPGYMAMGSTCMGGAWTRRALTRYRT